MKKIFALASGPLLVLALLFGFWNLNPMQRDILGNAVLEKLPFLRNFAVITAKTSSFGLDFKESGFLKTQSFYIDYLVDMEQETPDGKKRFVALYPYVVEAGVDMRQITRQPGKPDGKQGSSPAQTLALPAPQVWQARQDDSREALVIRSNLDVSWESTLKPIKVALAEKARLDALKDGILEKAGKAAQARIKDWLPKDSPLAVIYETPKEKPLRLAPENLGLASFALPGSGLQLVRGEGFARTDAYLAKASDLLAGMQLYTPSLREFGPHVPDPEGKNGEIRLNFFDASAPSGKKTSVLFTEDEGLSAYIAHNNRVYRIMNLGDTPLRRKETKAPALGLALNALPETRPQEADYADFISLVDNIARSLLAGDYPLFAQNLKELQKLDSKSPLLPPLQAAEAYFLRNEFRSSNDADLNALAQLLLTMKNKPGELNDEMLGLAQKALGDYDASGKRLLAVYLCRNGGQDGTRLPKAVAAVAAAKTALIENGIVDKAAFASLTEAELCRLFSTWLEKTAARMKQIEKPAYVERNALFTGFQNNRPNTAQCAVSPCIAYNLDALRGYYNKKGQEKILEKLRGQNAPGLDKHFAALLDRGFLSIGYSLFVFTPEGFYYTSSAQALRELKKYPYRDAHIGTSLVIEGQNYDNATLLALFKELKSSALNEENYTENTQKALEGIWKKGLVARLFRE